MVWLMPSADTAQIHVVTLMTYLIAVGGFMHIVAGSMEAFMLAANGECRLDRDHASLYFAGSCRQRLRRYGFVRAYCPSPGHEGI